MPMTLEDFKKLYTDKSNFSGLISEDIGTNDPFSGSPLVDGFMERIINSMEAVDYTIDGLEQSSRKNTNEYVYQRASGSDGLTKQSIATKLNDIKLGKINVDIEQFLKKVQDGATNQNDRRVLNNYIVYINKIYKSINDQIDPGTSIQASEEIKLYKKKLLIAALKDRHAVSAKSKKSIFAKKAEDGNISSLSETPNLAKLQLSICSEENKKTDMPFVSYNGAVIFSLSDAQREILEKIDKNLKEGVNEPISIPLGVGEGKTFLSELIKKVYGTRNHGCNIDPEDPKKKVGGIYIGDTLVGYSTLEVIPDKYDLGLISDLKAKEKINPGKLYIGLENGKILYRVLDDKGAEKTGLIPYGKIGNGFPTDNKLEQFSEIKYQLLKAISSDVGMKLEDVFPSFDTESDKFPLVKIESLSLGDVSDLDIDKLKTKINEVIDKLKDKPKEKTRKMIVFDEFPHIDYELRKYIRKMLPENEYNLLFISATPNVELLDLLDPKATSMDARTKDDLYEIQTIEARDPQAFLNSYHGKTPVLIKSNNKYYVLGHDKSPGKRILTEITNAVEKDLFEGLERNIFGNNGSVLRDVTQITQKDMFTVKDVVTIQRLKALMKEKEYHIPLSKSQSLMENRGIFFKQFDQKSHIQVNSILNNKHNLIDLLKTDAAVFLNSGKPGNIQFILPDISPVEQNALLDEMKSKMTEFKVEQIIYQDAKKETYYMDVDGSIKPGLPEDKGQKVLMLYSSANAIGGDYDSFSKNVGLQVINSNSTPSASKMQQWTARYRKKYFMNELRSDCQVVVRTRTRTSEELQDNMIMEEKKHELLDALNVLRSNIIIAIGAEKLSKDQKKDIMRLVRKHRDIDKVFSEIMLKIPSLKLTEENKVKAKDIVANYNSVLDRIASFRSVANLSYLNTGGTKTTQYEIKLRNLLSEDEILHQKRIQLYGDNKDKKIITDPTLWNDFNEKRIKCLQAIDTKTDQINNELSIPSTQSDNMDISISQLHSICLSLDAINDILNRQEQGVFVGTVTPSQSKSFNDMQARLAANKTQLEQKLLDHKAKILKQFLDASKNSDSSFAAKQSELTQAFERLLAFDNYKSFTGTDFDDFKEKYIESLAVRHAIEPDEIKTQFAHLLRDSQNYEGYASYNRMSANTFAVAEKAVEARVQELQVEKKKTEYEREQEAERIKRLEEEKKLRNQELMDALGETSRLINSGQTTSLQDEINRIKNLTDLAKAQAELMQKAQEVVQLKQDLVDLGRDSSNERKQLEGQLLAAEQDKLAIEEKVTAANEQVATLRDELAAARQDGGTTEQARAALEQQLRESEERLQAREAELTAELQKQSTALKDLKTKTKTNNNVRKFFNRWKTITFRNKQQRSTAYEEQINKLKRKVKVLSDSDNDTQLLFQEKLLEITTLKAKLDSTQLSVYMEEITAYLDAIKKNSEPAVVQSEFNSTKDTTYKNEEILKLERNIQVLSESDKASQKELETYVYHITNLTAKVNSISSHRAGM